MNERDRQEPRHFHLCRFVDYQGSRYGWAILWQGPFPVPSVNPSKGHYVVFWGVKAVRLTLDKRSQVHQGEMSQPSHPILRKNSCAMSFPSTSSTIITRGFTKALIGSRGAQIISSHNSFYNADIRSTRMKVFAGRMRLAAKATNASARRC